MNYSTAFDRLTLYVDPKSDPVVLDDELDMLLAEHAVTVDVDDFQPSEDGWVPTYSAVGLCRAAAAAWVLKAGRVASRFDFTTDAQQFRRSQVVDHCLKMSAIYRRKVNVSAPVGEA